MLQGGGGYPAARAGEMLNLVAAYAADPLDPHVAAGHEQFVFFFFQGQARGQEEIFFFFFFFVFVFVFVFVF